MSDNVVDIIARNVIEKLGDEIEARTQAAVQKVIKQTQAELIDLAGVDTHPRQSPVAVNAGASGGGGGGSSAWPPAATPVVPAKVDAKDRAWRTLAQGLAVTVLFAIVTAFGTAVAAPEFDLLTWDSWRAAATAGGTAAAMAVAAYVQRLLSPPKSAGMR